MANKRTVSAAEYGKLVGWSKQWVGSKYRNGGVDAMPGVQRVEKLSKQYAITLIPDYDFSNKH